MIKNVFKLGGVAISALLLSAPAFADIPLHQNFSANGYVAGSYMWTDKGDSDHYDLDVAKLGFSINYAPTKAYISLFYDGDEINVLDAYVDYDFGNGAVVTGGRFLSFLGFEAFDAPNMYQISYANGDLFGGSALEIAPIPAYHSGVKVVYSDDAWSAGVAFLDSVYGGLKGDGEVEDNFGVEAFFSFTGVEKLTLFGGIAFQSEDDDPTDGYTSPEIMTFNFWASYEISDKWLVAGEFTFSDQKDYMDGYNWLALAKYAITPKISAVFRVSGEDVDYEDPIETDPSFLKFTLAPAYTITDNLSVTAEVSYYDYKDYVVKDDVFVGVQAIFKF
ncbi:porin [Termitidicoccus mucosus]|uniref:Porin domain-containing protein n=1 Tax=Termitidicoccus mucosus TaxID=1184151 RepID=A0A178IN45_9BACT|nr:hypothetical protein AW736_03995 [Opitutaceae bacterium TSB47]